MADEAAGVAQQTGDPVGEALAREARGDALERLQRAEEALIAWQDASQLWARTGDTPRHIRALAHAALSCVPPRNLDAEKLLAQGLSSLGLESQDLGAVAQALYDAGVAMCDLPGVEFDRLATDYLRMALEIREKQASESRELVETLNALAWITVDQGLASMDANLIRLASGYYTRAIQIGQRVAPGTPVVVEALSGLAKCESVLDAYDAARDHYLEALRIQRALATDGSIEEARLLNALGAVEETLTHFAPAREFLAEALAMGERLSLSKHSKTAYWISGCWKATKAIHLRRVLSWSARCGCR
jgi:tetratricopeptide (TPR) repeat protein